MNCCWQQQPEERPTASDLVGLLAPSGQGQETGQSQNTHFMGSSPHPTSAEEPFVPSILNGGPFLPTATSHFMYPVSTRL